MKLPANDIVKYAYVLSQISDSCMQLALTFVFRLGAYVYFVTLVCTGEKSVQKLFL